MNILSETKKAVRKERINEVSYKDRIKARCYMMKKKYGKPIELMKSVESMG